MKCMEERTISRRERMACICHRGASFFDGWKSAQDLSGREMDENEFRLEYEFLFRGTDADFLPPLWASVSCGDRELCNSTTLNVIRIYHRWGYRPKRIEGNPPDYIGEQLHFLAYLYAAGITDEAEKVRDDFLQEYTLENLKAVIEAVEERGTPLEILPFLRGILRELAGFQASDLPASSAEERNWLNAVEAAGVLPAICGEQEHIVPTAGINNCGGKCVIRPTVAEGCITKIETDCTGSPQLRACVRGRGYRKTYLAPERLRYPMKRLGERGSGKFERISWEEAADLIAAEWVRIRDTYGAGSRYLNYATGVTGILRPRDIVAELLALDGGYLNFFNSYSSACVEYVSEYIYGTSVFGSSPQELLNAKLVVLWGNNEAETIIGTERNQYLSKVRALGGKVIVIDPRMSQTAVAYADLWVPVRPSTDSALADAIAWVLWKENLQDQAFMDRYCLGFDEKHMPKDVPAGESYYAYIFGAKDGVEKTPEWAEEICGVPAGMIRRIARLIGTEKPASIVAGYGPQRNGNGEQTTRSICALAAMTGNIGIPGGNAGSIIFTKEHERPKARLSGVTNPFPGAIPSFLWTKAVEKGPEMTPSGDRLKGVDHLDSGIKMMFNLAGNTLVNQHSDINRTIRILKDSSLCECIICSDIFMTPSARFADILLPAPSVFESVNITPPWRGDNYLLKNNRVIDPLFETRFEWEWTKDVARRIGLYEALTLGGETEEEILEKSYEGLREKEPELPDYETFSREGGWQYREQVSFVAFQKEIADPDNHPFPTPSGKIEIFSRRLYDMGRPDIPGIPRYIACPEGPSDPLRERFPLQLMGWHTRRRCHSVHDNNEWMDEVEKPCLWIHPEDAFERGISQNEEVLVFNDRGSIRIHARVTERICKGVVAMPQGAWYTPGVDGVDRRGCINVLTGQDHPSPLAKGNPQHTNLVQVRHLSNEQKEQ